MNIALWVVQGILALMFGMAGIIKMGQPQKKLAVKMPWVNDYSATTVKIIGFSEFIAAVGLIVPFGTGVVPVLTPIAAVGLGLVMILAAIYHYGKREMKEIGINVFLFALCGFVAYGRFQ